ncbi:exopolyphosphatase [Arachidicoccus ginsenosidimutans]|uniref:DHH family phosphoesterase n=1 Tax=Arachidicoccus sp. BS20 TaxID=1850526 RepID=UPI0007F0D2FA|nr:bifunctional oligoribonuclease/PAP phosphatase NrnA [Arachidicoccus sp. BS20]ANI88899.1 exopolyphosphatase [Arachidicoccus sp. BS20]
MNSIETFYPLLGKQSKVVITMHQKPDGDAMGSALGLYHFLIRFEHEVTVISPTNWANFLNWMPCVEKVHNYENCSANADKMIEAADWIFCLDFNVLHRTKSMEQSLLKAKAVKILIDHHEQPQTEVFDYGISLTSKSSTCEMIYDFIVGSGNRDKINLDIATCLYTGLMTDTGSFRFPSTTASVHLAVAYFKEIGLNHSIIHEKIYDVNTEDRLHLLGNSLAKRMEVFYEYNAALMAITKADLLKFSAKTGDTEGLVNYLLSIEGIKFGALVIDRDEERKWSFRSKGSFDVNEFARKHFNGGGHKNAAGGHSKDSLEETVRKFKEILLDYAETLR